MLMAFSSIRHSLSSYSYFREAARVTAPGGFVVVDIFSEAMLHASEQIFPCFLSTDYVRKIFREFSLVETLA